MAQVVVAKPGREPRHLVPGGAEHPLQPPRPYLAPIQVTQDRRAGELGLVNEQFGGQRGRDRDRGPGDLSVQPPGGVLHGRVDDPQRKINILWVQPTRLGGPQPTQGTQQDRYLQVGGHHSMQRPNLLPSRHIGSLLAHPR